MSFIDFLSFLLFSKDVHLFFTTAVSSFTKHVPLSLNALFLNSLGIGQYTFFDIFNICALNPLFNALTLFWHYSSYSLTYKSRTCYAKPIGKA